MKKVLRDRRITIQQKTVVVDSNFGAQEGDWADFAVKIQAQVQDLLPSKYKVESDHKGLIAVSRPSRVRMQFIPGIDSTMRVILHGEIERTCQIISQPAELGRREGLEFMIADYQ